MLRKNLFIMGFEPLTSCLEGSYLTIILPCPPEMFYASLSFLALPMSMSYIFETLSTLPHELAMMGNKKL